MKVYVKTTIRLVLNGLLVAALLILAAQSAMNPAVAQSPTTYSADLATAFANPERGFHNRYEIINDVSVNDYASSATSIAGFNPDMLDRTFARAKANGNTIIHSYLHLDKFQDTDTLPQALLDNLASGLAAIRTAGLKMVLRPAYAWSASPTTPESRILGHIAQINTVLSANADVVLHLETGYLGPWGEWHTSIYTDAFNRQYADTRYRIVQKIISTTPSSIPVVVRYPIFIRELLTPSVMPAPAGTPALTQEQMNRIGFHNDCFLADSADMGTYDNNSWMGWFYIEEKKQWMYDLATSFGANKMVGGETCDADGQNDAAGINVQAEMSKLNFTEINEDFAAVNINKWKNNTVAASGNDPAETVFVRLKRKMGYRIRLINATFPTSATAGGNFTISANLQNDGYAGIIKQRPLFLVFKSSTARFDIPLSGVDVRLWLSGANSIAPHSVTLPSNMPNGTYQLALWLPDENTGLRTRPEYSVRFANQGIWDSTNGFNVLSNSISISGGCTSNCPTNVPTNTPVPPSATFTPTNTPVGPTATNTRTNTPTATTVVGNSYEAESANNTLAGGALIATCVPCSNSAKVGYVGNNAGTLQFNGVSASSAGSYTVTIFYTNGAGSARTAALSVNSGGTVTLSFPDTGGWMTVGSLTTTVSLNAGNNTLRFSNPSAGSWTPDFDRIVVNSGTAPTNTPTATFTRTNTPAGPTATFTRTSTPAPTFQPPTNTPAAPTATSSGTPLSIDAFADQTKWTNHLNDINQSLSWSMDSLYYGTNPPGNIVMNSGGVNQYYQENINRSLSGYTTLVLRLRDWNSGSGTEQHWNIILNDGTDHSVALSAYSTITGSYQDFSIPLSAFGANLSNVAYLRITHKDNIYAVLLVDAISVR
jgi:hypothetical protein